METNYSPDEKKLRSIGFLDIETVPRVADQNEYEELYTKRYKKSLEDYINGYQALHDKPNYVGGAELKNSEQLFEEHFMDNAGMTAEFGKIVNITVGKMHTPKDGTEKLYIKSIARENELELLQIFIRTLAAMNPGTLCAHNGLEFDFPIIRRRILVHGLKLPAMLDSYGKKPWETPFEDTMDQWAGSQYKYKCSLDLLAKLFNLPSPKEKLSGADVAGLYYNPEMIMDEKLKAIGEYGAGDVVTLVNVWCKMRGLPIIPTDGIEYVRA